MNNSRGLAARRHYRGKRPGLSSHVVQAIARYTGDDFHGRPQDIVSMPKFRPGRVLTGLLLVALLAGCGQKGPLYLPKPQPQPPSSEQPSTVKP